MPLPGWIVPAITAVTGIGQGLLQQRAQGKENMRLAQFQAQANERYLDKQLEYNTPANQMKRFQDAGLNPNLIYGQGNPGNQSAPLTHPDVKPRDFSQMVNMAQIANQSRMVDAQVQATNANTQKSVAQTELTKLQALVAQKNPLLNNSAYDAIISSLISTADIKSSESKVKGQHAKWMTQKVEETTQSGYYKGELGMKKMDQELRILEQKFNLGNVDQKIKAEILNSKEFQNEILEVQKRFMTDGDITPQHILTFVQLLLMRLMK